MDNLLAYPNQTKVLENIKYLGNQDLLKLQKTAFLCSRKIPAAAVLKCYDWAIKIRDEQKCIVSGFHSPLEKDVLDILIKGRQPIIVALANKLPKKIPRYFQQAFEMDRILMISNFKESIIRASTQTAEIRNKLMLELADEIVVGYCSESGQLKRILSNSTHKQIHYLTTV